VVAGGQHIRAQIEQVLGDLRGQAEAAGGVFGVDDDQIDVMRLAITWPMCSRTILRPALPKMSPTKRMFKNGSCS
jgi:hypothetical protein